MFLYKSSKMNSKQSPHKPDHKNEPIKAFKRGSVLALFY